MSRVISTRPNPDSAFPNPKIPSLCFIKNVVKNPRIIIGNYTYYDDVDGADQFEKHVTHFYDFIGDKLIIGKFCAIAKGIEFVMNGANHRMDGVTTYPFYIMGGDWGGKTLCQACMPCCLPPYSKNDASVRWLYRLSAAAAHR